jgi:hypothetical protein
MLVVGVMPVVVLVVIRARVGLGMLPVPTLLVAGRVGLMNQSLVGRGCVMTANQMPPTILQRHTGTPALVRMLRGHTRKPRKPEPVMVRKVTLLGGPGMQGNRDLDTTPRARAVRHHVSRKLRRLGTRQVGALSMTHPGIVRHHVLLRMRSLNGPGMWMSRMSEIRAGPGKAPTAMIHTRLTLPVRGGPGKAPTTIVVAMIHTPLTPLVRVLGILWGMLGGVGRCRIRQP